MTRLDVLHPADAATENKYRATVGGYSWSRGPEAEFPTILAARAFAESFGITADYCNIYDRRGCHVATHMRDGNGDGTRWYRVRV